MDPVQKVALEGDSLALLQKRAVVEVSVLIFPNQKEGRVTASFSIFECLNEKTKPYAHENSSDYSVPRRGMWGFTSKMLTHTNAPEASMLPGLPIRIKIFSALGTAVVEFDD